MREVETPQGVARVHETDVPGARARLFLGHGAGGSVTAPDLRIASRVANEEGISTVLVEQPYRVAGRRSTPPPPRLDEAWIAVLADFDDDLPHVSGGRSSGARVACRTAAASGAVGVLCLAFPLVTPRGVSRQAELDGVSVPLLIVQGERDRFGVPDGAAVVRGDHGLKGDAEAIEGHVRTWLRGLAPIARR